MATSRLAIFRFALVIAGAASAAPAFATSCDMDSINKRSVKETARLIYDLSDNVGFAFVREVTENPAVKQQEADIFAPLKGQSTTVRLSPEAAARVGRVDEYVRWWHWKPNEIHLVALENVGDGAVTHSCLAAAIAAKPQSELYRELIESAPVGDKSLGARQPDTKRQTR